MLKSTASSSVSDDGVRRYSNTAARARASSGDATRCRFARSNSETPQNDVMLHTCCTCVMRGKTAQ